ncbi:hypothetical protein [Mycobacterium sp. 1274761.0]|uniref:hypothetical protein n=1 Tax=Mycobacterium sp. 1274761.0 TaxID=1834077 RepID=UPI0007FBF062|nr:hypothetical protein [Mycobacterium sp. 1274761.0]OBK72742.1 hypothetical protein A5651_15350 [Mycobacterium sp. 1274761.0]
MKNLSRISAEVASAVGYLLLLAAFTSLGLFIAALAAGSALAAILGIGLIACLAGSVIGFRSAAQALKQSGVFAEATSPVSIFSSPLRRQEVDRYLESYRGEQGPPGPSRTMTVIAGASSPRRTDTEHVEPSLLSA